MKSAEAADRTLAHLVAAQFGEPPGPVHSIIPSENRDERIASGLTSNPYGLLSEDIDPTTGTRWGDFPQTYSMASIIASANSADGLSVRWEDVWCRASS
jgi:hypothetical protein